VRSRGSAKRVAPHDTGVKRANFVGECDRRATQMIGWSIFFRGYDFWQHKMTGVISMTRKTGALRVSLLIESARHDRCGRLCCDDTAAITVL
jgi:hypothetical protein